MKLNKSFYIYFWVDDICFSIKDIYHIKYQKSKFYKLENYIYYNNSIMIDIESK